MTYRYFEMEDRLYRAPATDLARMELRNPTTRQWERYRGDVARVLAFAPELVRPPKGQA